MKMCTYGFTDGSSAFGSNSSQPTPLQSTTSGFSNNVGPSGSLSAPPSLGNGGTAVSSANAGFGSPALFGTPTGQPSQSVSSPSGFWNNGGQSSFPTTASPSIPNAWSNSSPSPFGSSPGEQRPGFSRGFGYSAPTQSVPFGGSTFQQSQPAFGSSASLCSPNHPFGGSTTSPFGSQQTASPFGSQQTSPFGYGGGFCTSPFGHTVGTPPTFSGQPYSFWTTSPFGQTNSKSGSSNLFSTPGSFGPQTCSFGTQPARGSKVVAYAPTAESSECTIFGGGRQSFENGKYVSISAMPVYKEKSHEELRWEDYQLGCKGNSGFGSTPFAISSNQAASPSGVQSSPFPLSGGSQQNSGFGSPSHPVLSCGPHRFGFPSWTSGPPPARYVFKSTPSYEPKVETVKSEATQLASGNTQCPELEGEKKMDKILRDFRKVFDAERESSEGKQLVVSSSTHFPEPQDDEDVKKIDKKRMQDLRRAVEVEREVERRVSAKHIAFLTSMLEKLDSLCISTVLTTMDVGKI